MIIRRPSSPSTIATVTSLIVSTLCAGFIYLLISLYKVRLPFYLYVIIWMVMLLISVVLYRYALINFINDKLKIIYKTIGKPLKFQKQIINRLNSNIMQSAERDVGEWAIKKNKQIRELRKMESYRKEFIGTVSHELRTPIFNVQGYIETIMDGVDSPERERDYLKKAMFNIERLDAIVSNLLEISKFEAGRIQLDKKVFNIIGTVKRIFDQYSKLAEDNHTTMSIDYRSDTLYVWGDQKRLIQVLENLISNAIKYGKDDGKVIVGFFDLDEQIIVEVTDDGNGIPEENLPHIFERFYRVDKSRSRSLGGTGLGLSIVQNIIEAHDQSITVRSQVGVGTTFSFSLDKAPQKEIDKYLSIRGRI